MTGTRRSLAVGAVAVALGLGALAPVEASARGGVPFVTLSLPRGTAAQDSANRTAYQALEDASPGRWGGAYVDGDEFVIKVPGTNLEAARNELNAAGIMAGVRLESSAVSVADLDAQKARVRELARGKKNVRSWGPNYADGTIVVDVGEDQGLVRDDLARLAGPDRPAILTYDAGGAPATVG